MFSCLLIHAIRFWAFRGDDNITWPSKQWQNDNSGCDRTISTPKNHLLPLLWAIFNIAKYNDPVLLWVLFMRTNWISSTIPSFCSWRKKCISVWEPTLCSHGKYSYYDVFVAITLKQFSLMSLVQMARLMHRTFTCMHVIWLFIMHAISIYPSSFQCVCASSCNIQRWQL